MAEQSEPSPPFNAEQFVKDYADAAALQATVIAGAFVSVENRMDRGFARIERVLALAYPSQYRRMLDENGHKPAEPPYHFGDANDPASEG